MYTTRNFSIVQLRLSWRSIKTL